MSRIGKPLLFVGCIVILAVLVIGTALNDGFGTMPASEWVSAHPTEPSAALLINLNTATEKELLQLPEMTRATAQAIVTYRDSFVRFRYVEELLSVRGVSQERFELWRPYLIV